MLTIGIHVGFLTIRISQSRTKPRDPRIHFDTVEWPSHKHTDWYAYYGGALPNAYEASSGRIGYDAVDEFGVANVRRFDTEFFVSMLDDGSQGDRACAVWEQLQRAIRRCPSLQVREEASVALVLDGVNLSHPLSNWTPWDQTEDRTPALQERLQSLGERGGLRSFQILSRRSAVSSYVAAQDAIRLGDVIADVGGASTRLWEVVGPAGGDLKPIGEVVGLEHLIGFLTKAEGFTNDTLKRLLGVLQQPNSTLDAEPWPALSIWLRQRLLPYAANAVALSTQPGATQRCGLWLGGEGASLLKDLVVSSVDLKIEPWEADLLYLPAFGAAAAAYLHSASSLEE